MRRFLAESLPTANHTIELDRETSHHLLRVVGIAPGEKVELFDGKGGLCIASLLHVQNARAVLQWEEDAEEKSKKHSLWMGLALTKRDAFSTALRMLTEMGVSEILPIQSSRSIAKGNKLDRWKKIVLSATAQSKQAHLPTVHAVHSFSDALEYLDFVSSKWILHTQQEGCASLPSLREDTAILVGPEGGFTEAEVEEAVKKGWNIASLSSSVLRADTAAIVAAALALKD